MKIDFIIKKDFRKFKEGDKFCLDIVPNEILYVAAPNRFGKTTLLNGLRGLKDSLAETNKYDFDGMTSSARELAYLECGACMDISGYDYDEAFFMEVITDDPTSFENSATAGGLVGGGGFFTQKMSKGEKAIYLIAKIKDRITKYLNKKYGSVEEWKTSGKTGLIVLDEIDDGLDPFFQTRYNELIFNQFVKGFNLDVVVVSHSLICPLGKTKFKDCSVKVYNMQFHIKLTPKEHFEIESGFIIKEENGNDDVEKPLIKEGKKEN
jgi:hypothetical protein